MEQFFRKFSIFWIVCSALICVRCLSGVINSGPTNSDIFGLPQGIFKVYRIVPSTNQQLHFLTNLWKNATQFQLDFWKAPRGIGAIVDVMVAPDEHRQFRKKLRTQHIPYRVIIQDVQKKIEQDEKRSREFNSEKILRDSIARSVFNFRRYQSYEDMRRYMRSIEFAHSKIAKVYTIGHSHEGRPIEIMKIGFPVTDESKRMVWVDGGMHAREWAAQHVVTYFIHELTTKYDRDPEIRQLVDSLTFFIVPNVNPDGYEYSRTDTHPYIRLWRKNRSPKICAQGSLCCGGVDLNRNFDIKFAEIGTSDHPCSGIYGGPQAFSEPETRAIRDVIWPRRSHMDVFLTFHTYAQMWTHAYGYVRGKYPPDVKELGRVGQKAADAIRRVNGTDYKVGGSADLLYASAGGSDDWAKVKAGVKYVYLIELRPDVTEKDGFILPENLLLPTAMETWRGAKAVFDEVLQKQLKSKKHLSVKPLKLSECTDEPNPRSQTYTCRQQKGWGWCDSDFMRGFCLRSCGHCSGGVPGPCTDSAPAGPYTCDQYKQWGMCSQSFMFGFCELTCNTCTAHTTRTQETDQDRLRSSSN